MSRVWTHACWHVWNLTKCVRDLERVNQYCNIKFEDSKYNFKQTLIIIHFPQIILIHNVSLWLCGRWLFNIVFFHQITYVMLINCSICQKISQNKLIKSSFQNILLRQSVQPYITEIKNASLENSKSIKISGAVWTRHSVDEQGLEKNSVN